ncbi:DUF2637 domain-containing protein [Microbispora sp. RL4-1S]|uniref:DUF2637 domain-containing protein n=1 Tax=Microbispora oryzae TaxID=2806554 RepID=A0A940WP34_9ACTN|nr:DUF2637 domain-containing protein [Microbispora oryzae]
MRRTTIAGVALLALIAAVVSFRHMHELCLRHGEDRLAAVLIPLAVDGLIVVASMSILLANRYGSRGGVLAWNLLAMGSLASLGANIAVAEPSLIGRIIAAWPSLALIGSYELLMSQIRRCTGAQPEAPDLSAPEPATDADADPVEQQDEQQENAELSTEPHGNGRTLQRAAWRWAQRNRQEDGDLPSGVAIARAFARSPRWGRLVKKAGLAGELTDAPTRALLRPGVTGRG